MSQEFRSAARRAFAWLKDEFNFEEVGLEDDLVEFRSRTAFFVVARVGAPDPSYKLLDSRLGRLGVAGAYSLRSIARHVEPRANVVTTRSQLSSGRFPANSPEEMQDSLRRLATEWRRRLKLLSLEDDSLWKTLAAEGGARIMELADDDPRSKAIEAFRQGDYAAAIVLYDRTPGSLTPADRKRISIARKRLSGS